MPQLRPSGPPIRVGAALVWRGSAGPGDAAELALVRDGEGWALPGEAVGAADTEPQAALRAARALVGPTAVLGPLSGTTRATVHDGGRPRLRLTTAWAVRHEGDPTEDDAVRWLAPASAADLLGERPEAALVAAFARAPRVVARLLLVRHAEAAPADGGPDVERRLTAHGRARAERLSGVLAAFSPVTLACSPARRCMETIAPAASALGLEVDVEPLIAEQAARDEAEALLRSRAAGALARGGSAVACTHAPAILDVLERLSVARPELLMRPARLDPGGIWSVELVDQAPRVLHYLPPPAVEEPR